MGLQIDRSLIAVYRVEGRAGHLDHLFVCCFQAGGVGCGIYTTNAPEACHYIADNCSANIIFAENKMQIAKILQASQNSERRLLF